MNRQIATSAVSILAMLTMVSAATFAFFSDSGTSSGNTFSTGTLDLKLTDNNETAVDNVTTSFGGNLAPGQCTGNQTLELKNAGTIAANHAEVTISNVVTDTNADAADDIDEFMRIDTLQYDSGNVVAQIAETNGNGFIDLADWDASATALDDLTLNDLGPNHALVLNVCLDSLAGNTLQGDSVDSTFTVTLNQNASQ